MTLETLPGSTERRQLDQHNAERTRHGLPLRFHRYPRHGPARIGRAMLTRTEDIWSAPAAAPGVIPAASSVGVTGVALAPGVAVIPTSSLSVPPLRRQTQYGASGADDRPHRSFHP